MILILLNIYENILARIAINFILPNNTIYPIYKLVELVYLDSMV